MGGGSEDEDGAKREPTWVGVVAVSVDITYASVRVPSRRWPWP